MVCDGGADEEFRDLLMLKQVAFARLANYFLLRSQKKVIKEKATPCRLFPALLILMGGNRKLAYAQTADCR